MTAETLFLSIVLGLIVLYCSFDGVLGEHGAVQLDWRKLEMGRNVCVL